MTFFYNRHNKR